MSEKLNDIFKTTIPRETTFSEVFIKLAAKADKINEMQPFIRYENYMFENVFALPEIKDIRNSLNKYVFQRLMREAFKANELEYDKCSQMCTFNE